MPVPTPTVWSHRPDTGYCLPDPAVKSFHATRSRMKIAGRTEPNLGLSPDVGGDEFDRCGAVPDAARTDARPLGLSLRSGPAGRNPQCSPAGGELAAGIAASQLGC